MWLCVYVWISVSECVVVCVSGVSGGVCVLSLGYI